MKFYAVSTNVDANEVDAQKSPRIIYAHFALS